MSESSKRSVFTRRQALLLSATAGISVVAGESALASDSIKTAAHQEPGNCSTPASAVAKTQYGKVRGFLDGEVIVYWNDEHGDWLRQAFVSRPDNVVVQLHTPPKGQSLNTRIMVEMSGEMRPGNGMWTRLFRQRTQRDSARLQRAAAHIQVPLGSLY